MDIISSLTILSKAIDIAKDLKDIDERFNEATYKAQIAEIYSSLADVKMALTDAKSELHDKDQEIATLNLKIDALKNGDSCPLCSEGRLKVTSSNPHPEFGDFCVQERVLVCNNDVCTHTETLMHDPLNRLKKS